MASDRPPSYPAPEPVTPGPGAPRVLCVLDRHPLPADTGARRRLWNVLRGIAGAATGTAVVLGGDTEPDRVDALAAALPGWHVLALPRDRGRRPIGRTLRDVGAARLPVHLARRDLSGWRAALAAELAAGYDAVYVSHPRPFVLVEEITDLPLVASIDDLAHLRADRVAEERRARDAVADAADARTWPKLHLRICERASVVLVPSPEDRAELPGGRIMVLPDGADIPADLAADLSGDRARTTAVPSDGRAPTILLHGPLTDAPNADGAAFVIEHVIDEVRRRVPDAHLRVAGPVGAAVRALAATHPAVHVIGYVDDLAPELRAADVAAIPCRGPGGSRHRVLEALAHGLPVVTTSDGLVGLDLTPGRQALVADDAASLAAAITRVLRDPALADALRAEGLRVVRERYDWATVRHLVGEIIAGVTAAPRHVQHV